MAPEPTNETQVVPPSNGRPPEGTPEFYAAWWGLVARILAFFFGAVILYRQTFVDHADRQYLLGVALTLMLPFIVATGVEIARGRGR